MAPPKKIQGLECCFNKPFLRLLRTEVTGERPVLRLLSPPGSSARMGTVQQEVLPYSSVVSLSLMMTCLGFHFLVSVALTLDSLEDSQLATD